MYGKDQALLERITMNPEVKVGKPVIRGTRLTVDFIIGLLGHGMTFEDILTEYSYISREDILACLLFAQKSLEDITFMPLGVAEAV